MLNRHGLTFSEANRKELEALRLPLRNIFNNIIMSASFEAQNIQLSEYSEEIVLRLLKEDLAFQCPSFSEEQLTSDTKFIEFFAEEGENHISDCLPINFANELHNHFSPYQVDLGKIYEIIYKKGGKVGELIEYLQSLGRPAEAKA